MAELDQIIIGVQRERVRPAAFTHEAHGTAPAASKVDQFNLVGVQKFLEAKSPAGTVLNRRISDKNNFDFVTGRWIVIGAKQAKI